MKLEALDHPKTFDFADRLGVGMAQAIGHLELFWAFAARKSPQGDVGKWADGAIARSCFWEGDSGAFVQALIDAGFVERDGTHRLVVHDWHEHMPNWVRAKLKKDGNRAVTELPGQTSDDSADISGDASADLSDDASADLSGDSVREGKGSEVNTNTITPTLTLEPTPPGDPPTKPKAKRVGCLTGENRRRFDAWWGRYPRKVAKPEAEKVWARLAPDDLLTRRMCEATARQNRSEQWQRDGGQYIPHPATWLRQRRWEDQAVPPTLAPGMARPVDPIEARVVHHDS